jgi:hypothetical protein
MDLALVIFNVGAGLGVLAAGAALVYLAWQATPLIRESRALIVELRRLTRTTDTELRPILAHARELAGNVEVLTEDVAVKLDRLNDLMNALQQRLDAGEESLLPRRGQPAPVESWETREDPSDA